MILLLADYICFVVKMIAQRLQRELVAPPFWVLEERHFSFFTAKLLPLYQLHNTAWMGWIQLQHVES